MAYTSMLKHRGEVYRLEESSVNGYSTMTWKKLPGVIVCFLDLNFLRRGKDPAWTPEAGRTEVRTGVLFAKADSAVKSGDRIKMLRGPQGVFSVEGAIDEAWRPVNLHHLEFGVQEVAQSTLGQAT